MKSKTVAGICYSRPVVTLVNESGIGVSELAARTCYDSFDKSENRCIQNATTDGVDAEDLRGVESSDLLDSLAWVHHHHSILEHTYLSYLIKGTSRGVLQEHARHRLQNISVRSTRYTMSSVINAFLASYFSEGSEKGKELFVSHLTEMDMLVVSAVGDEAYCRLEWEGVWEKLLYQFQTLGKESFLSFATTKRGRDFLLNGEIEGKTFWKIFDFLQSGKQKRNVGDAFKHIVTDNWKVDMVVTFNLRSLKNYFDLRNSGAAWFQIRWLAQEMIAATPEKYLSLILKEYRDNSPRG